MLVRPSVAATDRFVLGRRCLRATNYHYLSERSSTPVTCPYLSYRTSADGESFDEARAYCGAAERFVQPMRADICNDRFELDHAEDCEIYVEHASDDPDVPDPAVSTTAGGDS